MSVRMLKTISCKDVNIRKAFSLLIDRQALVDYFGAYTSVATTFTNNSGYNDDIPVWERDLEKAEQLLIDAGYDFSDTVQILAYYTDQATIDVMDIVVANFAEIGISAEYTIEGTDPNTLWEEGRNIRPLLCGSGRSKYGQL